MSKMERLRDDYFNDNKDLIEKNHPYKNHVNKFIKYLKKEENDLLDEPLLIDGEVVKRCVNYYNGAGEMNSKSTVISHLDSLRKFFEYLYLKKNIDAKFWGNNYKKFKDEIFNDFVGVDLSTKVTSDKEISIVMRFDTLEEIEDFLLRHKNMELYSKINKKFLVVETEKNKKPEYKERIEATFICNDGKLVIPTLDKYKLLSRNAQEIIDCIEDVEEKTIKIQIGKTLKEVNINLDEDLYYEVFHFITDIGLGYWRYEVEDGEQIGIYLNPESVLCIR